MKRIPKDVLVAVLCIFTYSACINHTVSNDIKKEETKSLPADSGKQADTGDYTKRMVTLSNQDSNHLWPVETPAPLPGSVLPFKRIVAFYGNLFSKNLGVLGSIPKTELLQKLDDETQKWAAADPATPVIKAFHCIGVVAWDRPNTDGKYRGRVSFAQVDTLLQWAKETGGLVFMDIQVGLSTLQEEIPPMESYLAKENVHLGIDPEFSMKNGSHPSKAIGTFNAADINYAIDFLAGIVKKYHLPPKVLVVHRFTAGMMTDYKKIKKLPEVQVIIAMDGFGSKTLKKQTYDRYIYREPVEFTGFKLFYKQDAGKNSSGMMTPAEVLSLTPKPVYIQYQ